MFKAINVFTAQRFTAIRALPTAMLTQILLVIQHA
jgi:hypothetical protein